MRLSKQQNQHRQRTTLQTTPISSRRDKRKTSTPKRSNRNSDSNSASRNRPRLQTEFLDENISSNIEYDLSRPSSSQRMFESRITVATARPPTPSMKSNDLDSDVTCNPRQFQAEWQGLQNGTTLSHRVCHLPPLSDCHKHFHARKFFVVASGVIGGDSKLFIVARRLRNKLSRCLAEVTFNSTTYKMKAEIRCNQDEARFFRNALDLKELFEELV